MGIRGYLVLPHPVHVMAPGDFQADWYRGVWNPYPTEHFLEGPIEICYHVLHLDGQDVLSIIPVDHLVDCDSCESVHFED